MKKMVFALVLLSALLLGGLLTAQAQELPEGQNIIQVKVEKEDPANPGTFIPAEGVEVIFAHHRTMPYSITGRTDAAGELMQTHLLDGISIVHLSAYTFDDLSGYIMDDQIRFVQMNVNSRLVVMRFRLLLANKGDDPANPPTGGIRFQTAYYPYGRGGVYGGNALSELIEYQGPQVAASGFIVFRESAPQYWHSDKGFVDTQEEATVFEPGADGVVLIDGLPAGESVYFKQARVAPGCVADPDFGSYPAYIQANAIINYHQHFITSAESYDVLFKKQDGGPGSPGLMGAQFIVSRLSEGKTTYLYYRRPLIGGWPVLPAYTEDKAQAHVFTSGEKGVFGDFAVAGLMATVPETGQAATYFLEEIKAPAGYDPITEPVKITQDMAYVDDDTVPIDIINNRSQSGVLVRKYNQEAANDPYMSKWVYLLGGAEYLLAKAPGDDMPGDGKDLAGYTLLLGYQDGEALFSRPLTASDFDGRTPNEAIAALVTSLKPLVRVTDDLSGHAFFESPLPAGWYRAVEVKSPAGYQMPDTPWSDPDMIAEDSFPTFIMGNKPLPGTAFIKKTDMSGKLSLPGAEFIVKFIRQSTTDWTKTESFLAAEPQEGQPLQLVANAEDAKPFVTDDKGMMILSYLPTNSDPRYVYEYVIFETLAPEGYLIRGQGSRSFSLPKDRSAYREVSNESAMLIPMDFHVKKELKNAPLKAGAFEIGLFQRGSDQPLARATNDASGDVWFREAWVPSGMPGDVQLYLKEIIPPDAENDHYVYDDKEYDIKAKVIEMPPPVFPWRTRQNGDTTVSVSAIALYYAGGFTFDDCVFVNDYQEPPAPEPEPEPKPTFAPIAVPLTVKKTLANGTLAAGDFSFVLKDAKGRVLARAQNDRDGTAAFPDRSFSREVTDYTYTIAEEVGTDARVVYDQTVYTVKVSTVAVDGQLQATVSYEKDGLPYDGSLVFSNKRLVPATGDALARGLTVMLLLTALLIASAWLVRFRRTDRP